MTAPEAPIKFLLVDDLDENLLALEALLHRDDLVCLKAGSGEEALELLLRHEFALALVDVQMPGMTGFELAEFMRGNERTRHVPIIFVTAGSADRERRFRGYEAGAVDFIEKPVDADILRSKANIFFDLHRQRRQILVQRDQMAALARQLQDADRRKNEFLAVLAHELRNPVAAFGSGLALLARAETAEKSAVIRAQMQRQVSHIARLVEDLLDVRRIDEGRISLRKEAVVLQDVIGFAVEKTRGHFEVARHRLTVNLPDTPIRLQADHARLAQIVGNLLTNAAKYTPNGGEIRLEVSAGPDTADIELSDNGVGIPAEMHERIFDMFTQVEGAGRRDGLGIGLSLVRQLVDLHGGTIRLKASRPGAGSTFHVSLPLGAGDRDADRNGL